MWLHNCVMTFVIVAVTSSCCDITCETVPSSPPPFLFFVGAKGEPGNEVTVSLNYEALLLKDNISSNSQAASEIQECVAMDSLYMFKCDFTGFQFIYGCLSVHRHNVSLCFYNPLSFPTVFSKLLFYKNTCKFT